MALAWAGGALLFLILFWKVRLWDPANELDPMSVDTYAQLLPMWWSAAEALRAGRVPLWNPHQASGHPFLADFGPGVLYPPHLTWLFLDPEIALELSIVLHLFAAWGFTYLFGRALQLSRPASALAGLGYALAGIVVHFAAWFTPAADSAAWLPLALLSLEKLLRGGRRAWSSVLAVAVAMPILAGWPQNFLYVLQALAVYGTVRAVGMLRAQGAQVVRAALLALLGVALGVALAAIQLLPSLELMALSPRAAGRLTGASLLLFQPSTWDLVSSTFQADTGPPRWTYIGMAPLVLLPVSLLARRRRGAVLALWAVVAFAWLSALAMHTRWFGWYLALPGVAWFRIPWRVIVLYAFAGSVLAGVGLDAVVRESRRRRRFLAGAVAAAAALAVVAAFDLSALSRLYLLAAGVLALAAASARRPRLRRAMAVAAVVLMAVDLFGAVRIHAVRPGRDLSLYDEEAEALDYIRQHQGLYRSYLHGVAPSGIEVTPRVSTVWGLYSISDYQTLSLERQAEFFAGFTPVVTALGYYPVPFQGGTDIALRADRMPLLSMLSLRYFGLMKSDAAYAAILDEAGWRRVFTPRAGDFAVWENPRPLPRAYVAYNWIFRDAAAALKHVWRPLFNPYAMVVLETSCQGDEGDSRARGEIQEARIVEYGPEHVAIDVEARADGFLVLTDTFFPGWRATVDGAPVPIHRANALFRAVRVSAGRHEVRFDYAPASFRIGAALSIAAVLVLASLCLPTVTRWRGCSAAPP